MLWIEIHELFPQYSGGEFTYCCVMQAILYFMNGWAHQDEHIRGYKKSEWLQ